MEATRNGKEQANHAVRIGAGDENTRSYLEGNGRRDQVVRVALRLFSSIALPSARVLDFKPVPSIWNPFYEPDISFANGTGHLEKLTTVQILDVQNLIRISQIGCRLTANYWR